MELLNNFWTLLTSPSEINTTILTAPFSFLEMYLYMNIFIALLKIETDTKTKFKFLKLYYVCNINNSHI